MISKMKGLAMPAGVLGMTGLPANSLSKGMGESANRTPKHARA